MRRIVFFCIPAHGHTNPTLPVVRALTARGHEVIYYSYEPFRASIEAAGARFVGCERFDDGAGQPDGGKLAKDILASTELIARLTLAMDAAVTRELEALKPDVIVADSVAFWGKLFARKLGIPCVCSTTTFAFNRYSARAMQSSLGDLLAMLVKLPRTARLLRPLRARGYPVKSALDILQSDDTLPTVVYTSKLFQPFSETFPNTYSFVGPCLRDLPAPEARSKKPMVYVSMGTVMREARFFKDCAEAFGDGRCDVIMSVGEGMDVATLGSLPPNLRAFNRVDQLAVLQSADVFVTHCGMNSASEALYFGVPLAMRPLTPEEEGVAGRVSALGAGLRLSDDGPAGIRGAVDVLLDDPRFGEAARRVAESFRECGGAEDAARAILAACKVQA